MSTEDIPYYRQRVLAERSRAAAAPSPRIAAVHDKLAHLYESLTERLERSQAQQDVDPPKPGAQQSH